MKKLKTWQKIFIAVCSIGFLCSLLLLVPFVQNFILDFGENFVVHRPLTRPVWIERFVGWGMKSCFYFVLLILIITFSSYNININKNSKIIKLFIRLFKNPFFGIFVLYLGILLIGFVLMCLAYMLPTNIMRQNVKHSASYFQISTEHGYQNPLLSSDSTLDDYTDALMLIEAAYKNDKSFPIAAMLNERPHIQGNCPYDDLVSVYNDGNKNYDVISYGRYWHGYEIFLKPLLIVTSYGGIRCIMMITQIVLLVTLIWLLIRKKYEKFIIPFVALWLFWNPAVLFLSMQYNTIFILTLISLLVILLFNDTYSSNKNLWIYHFFIFGCLTSYFDFLTYPLVTFGVPIVFLLVMHGENFKENFIQLLKCGIVWSLGYVMMWAGKWVIGSVVSGTDILTNAKTAVINRTGAFGDESRELPISYFDVIIGNLKTGYKIVIVFFVAITIFVSNHSKEKIVEKKNYILLITALLPFAWYFVAKNHSFIHSWMTYRNLGISVVSLLLFAVSMKDNPTKLISKSKN